MLYGRQADQQAGGRSSDETHRSNR